jgi:hypothetical protein
MDPFIVQEKRNIHSLDTGLIRSEVEFTVVTFKMFMSYIYENPHMVLTRPPSIRNHMSLSPLCEFSDLKDPLLRENLGVTVRAIDYAFAFLGSITFLSRL